MSSGGAAEVIDLSSDDDDDVREAPRPALLYVKPIPADVKPFLLRPYPPGCGALVPVKPEAPEEPVDTPPPALEPPPPQRLCRQFWKSGEYEVSHHNSVAAPNGRNRLRINPRFLHSNATSHKWAFGAIAELLDNAIDEVNNGATYVRVNKFTNPRDGSPSLLIRDNGGGMDPESLRRCMSFGFSDKQSDAFIGQYGNGFKTSTMRLGGDVIVFTQSEKDWTTTRSIGLLSYTFLMETGSDDVLVPTVDYKYDLMTCSFSQLLRIDQKLFSSNLSILLKWSPFASEAELLKQFDDMGNHGTKIIVFNLWFNDDGDMELDFDSDKKDILITGAHKKVKMDSSDKITSGNYVSNRLRHSLRAYASVLYLHLPENFRIILRGCDVEPHHIVNDLIYRECVMYKPQTGRISEPGIITTLGFIRGAPSVDVQGFNVYHKNRLILPFWKVANNSYGKGRGVVGVLETNFIKPTHDKQDFEKSILYQRLEHRLKEMTYEYWDLHCHRVGYDNKKLRRISGAVAHVRQTKVDSPPPSLPPRLLAADIPTNSLAVVKSEAFVTREESNSQTMTPLKRKLDSPGAITRAADQYGLDHTNDVVNGHQTQHRHVSQRKRFNEFKNLTIENRKLHDQCSQYEESEKQLVLKEQNLRAQIAQARNEYEKLFEELMAFDVKTEKF